MNTILGRRRHLPDIQSQEKFSAAKGHAERAAINTPVQGGAADVAMLAMLQIQNCPKLKALGWKLVLQVHDEVILEGPDESAEEALELVDFHMGNPFATNAADFSSRGKNYLKVALNVDGSADKTWYDAK